MIILGMGHTKTLCPFNKEVWAVNGAYKDSPRVDIVFQMHDYMTSGEYEELKSAGIKVVSKIHIEGLDCIVYPIDDIKFTFNTHYFANTVAYMIAYAIYKGHKEIELYGIDHAFFGEYVLAKSCVEYWIGRAEQSGIDVTIPEESALCKTPDEKLYGYETDFFDMQKHEKILIANTIE